MRVRLQATEKPDCGPLGNKTISKSRHQTRKKEIRNCARWSKVCGSQRNQATEKEIWLQNRSTSPVIQKEGKLPLPV